MAYCCASHRQQSTTCQRGRTDLDEHIPVLVVVESVGVGDFEFSNISTSIAAFPNQRVVGIFSLRVLVEILHVRMRRRRVEVVVELLDIFSVISCRETEVSGRAVIRYDETDLDDQ